MRIAKCDGNVFVGDSGVSDNRKEPKNSSNIVEVHEMQLASTTFHQELLLASLTTNKSGLLKF